MSSRKATLSPREASAQETRRRIVEGARELILDGGYTRMTVVALADRAGVSPQTLYNSVGGKAQVVKAVYDTMLAGDNDPVPMSERPEFGPVADAEDVEEWAFRYAAWCRRILERVGPLLGALVHDGPGGDDVLTELLATIEGERRRGNRNALAGLVARGVIPGGRRLDRLVDAVWVLTSAESYDRLVRRCGWTPRAYERWLSVQLRAAVGGAT